MMLKQAVLALYIPIAVFSGIACWLYFANVLVPTVRSGQFSLRKHALAVALTASLAAQFIGSMFYGLARIGDEYAWLLNRVEYIAGLKLLILFSAILAVAVYNKAVFGAQNLLRLNMIAIVIWAFSFVALLTWNQ